MKHNALPTGTLFLAVVLVQLGLASVAHAAKAERLITFALTATYQTEMKQSGSLDIHTVKTVAINTRKIIEACGVTNPSAQLLLVTEGFGTDQKVNKWVIRYRDPSKQLVDQDVSAFFELDSLSPRVDRGTVNRQAQAVTMNYKVFGALDFNNGNGRLLKLVGMVTGQDLTMTRRWGSTSVKDEIATWTNRGAGRAEGFVPLATPLDHMVIEGSVSAGPAVIKP